MRTTMKAITKGHPVAEVMLIGWCFSFLVEGASGFGTPAALGAPMLYSMGHGKLDAVACLLLFNGFSATFGAVGTPMWFGVGQATGLENDDQVKVGRVATMMLVVNALLLVPLIVRVLVPWQDVKRNLVFIYLSVLSIMLPMLGISFFSVEFPTLVAGLIGLVCTALLIVYSVGLRHVDGKNQQSSADAQVEAQVADDVQRPPSAEHVEDEHPGAAREQQDSAVEHIRLDADMIETLANQGNAMNIIPREVSEAMLRPVSRRSAVISVGSFPASADGDAKETSEVGIVAALLRTSPITLTVLLLVLTRIEPIGLKKLLTDGDKVQPQPSFTLDLKQLGDFSLSPSLVFRLKDIMRAPTAKTWTHAVLYVPSILPFVVVGTMTLALYRRELKTGPLSILGGVASRMQKPLVALAGALILVELLRGQDLYADSPAFIIGVRITNLLSYGFLVLSAALGSLGAFFSGSTTISNLTFGRVQQVAAENLDVDVYAILALQGVGAAIGNAVCLANIISASTVIGLTVPEGVVLKKVFPLVAAFCGISTVVCLPFLFA
jgi:L-lactate permease